MSELDFITEMVEEQLIKGNLRWLADFNEIHRDYTVGNVVFPIYAFGSLQEKGFFLSRIYSALVTPKYKINFFFYKSKEIDPKLLREMILSLKSKFGSGDNWIFLGLVQSQPLEKAVKSAVEDLSDRNVGVAIFTLASKEAVSSNNVLGKGLIKQLKLTEAKFEIFDLPNYLKSFTMVFCLGILIVLFIALSGLRQAVQPSTLPLTLLLVAAFSLIGGYRLYKTSYHTTLSLNDKGFVLEEGRKTKEGKWSEYIDAVIHVTSKREACIRLRSKKETFDLPISRAGISRKEAYHTIRQLIKEK